MNIFYENNPEPNGKLSEEESKHCSQVLRHKKGDQIQLVDGKGGKYQVVISDTTKKTVSYEIISKSQIEPKPFSIHLAISPTKNMDRMEWMVEKCSEIGVDQLTLLETSHSERRKLRIDRLEKKAVSAMKQSGNPFLLQLNPLTSFNEFVLIGKPGAKYIAHVDEKHPYFSSVLNNGSNATILIGPEGDFSQDELASAITAGYQPVSLGGHTLRTETAGFVACCMVNFINGF